MNLFDIYAHELFWALERDRVDGLNQWRVALQMPASGRGVRAEVASALCFLAARLQPKSASGEPAAPSCPLAAKRLP